MTKQSTFKFTVFFILTASIEATSQTREGDISPAQLPNIEYLIVQPKLNTRFTNSKLLKLQLQKMGIRLFSLPDHNNQSFGVESLDNTNDILQLIKEISGNETDVKVVPLEFMINSVQEGIN